MSIRSMLLDIWEEKICEGINRQALRRYTKASRLWHSGPRLNKIRAMLLNKQNIRRYGCDIYPQAVLGAGLYIPHFVGITIGNTTELGADCVIYPNVVFGAAYSPHRPNPAGRRHPKCGDRCVFGANSSIIGAITIGNDVTIGAGSVVTKDVPDGAIVTGCNEIVGYK